MAATATKKGKAADRQHGYVFGCDGRITRAEASEEFGLSLRTLDRLIAGKQIRSAKLGDYKGAPVKICRRSVAEYIQRHER